MVAVGLWGAQLGAPAIWLLPVTFPIVMALGRLPRPWWAFRCRASRSASPPPPSCSGAAVMTKRKPPLYVAAALVALRNLSRARTRHGVAARPERAPVQPRVRHRDGVPARHRHRDRRDPSLAGGSGSAARRRRRRRPRRACSSCGGRRREDATVRIGSLLVLLARALARAPDHDGPRSRLRRHHPFRADAGGSCFP